VTLKLFPDACHWTVGGSQFPLIEQSMFKWLNDESTKINNAVERKTQAA